MEIGTNKGRATCYRPLGDDQASKSSATPELSIRRESLLLCGRAVVALGGVAVGLWAGQGKASPTSILNTRPIPYRNIPGGILM